MDDWCPSPDEDEVEEKFLGGYQVLDIEDTAVANLPME
jgi:hypothetical protein